MTSMLNNVNPLRAADLLPSISQLWNTGLSKQAGHGLAKIGVCVSGGPDSMALAYLLKQIPLEDRTVLLEPLAFIVNHNARKGSEEEAKFVSAELEKLGIESVILTMKWPHTTATSSLPDFEMRAREMRYRLIARAAIRKRINHLFVGHHQDDQVETVLMRMLRNSPKSFLGLQGMAEQAAIPCCEDIRGAHEEADSLSGIKPGGKVALSQPGGLHVHRPLLGFPKSQLVKTCLSNGIQSVNDKTNHDPTLTLRNAVRHLRCNYHIPRALQTKPILQLQHWAHESSEALLRRGTGLLKKCKVMSFDLRSGVMMVTVPKDILPACEADPEAAANALARLTSVVSCQSKDAEPMLVPRQNLVEFVQKMEYSKSNRMNIQQVLLERMHSKPENDHEAVMWRLSRPPMRATEVELAKQHFTPAPGKSPTEKASLLWPPSPAVEKGSGLWSEWTLWDHRYWIRVKTKDPSTMADFQVRPYQKSDEAMLRQTFPKEWNNLQSIFAEAAPQKLRFTLPILSYKGQIQAFPTLNVMMPTSSVINISLKHHLALEWEVCYKSMDQPFIGEQRSTIEWRNVQV